MKKSLSIVLVLLLLAFGFSAMAEGANITDNFNDLNTAFDKSAGWQVDKSDAAVGSMINKCGNNEIQYVTYKLDNIRDFKLDILSFVSDMSMPKADVKIYLSKDNVAWEQIKFTLDKPERVSQSWRVFAARPANPIPEGYSYIKFELQELGIDELPNCFVTAFRSVEVSSKAPVTTETPTVSAETTTEATQEKTDATVEPTVSAGTVEPASPTSPEGTTNDSSPVIWIVFGVVAVLIVGGVTAFVVYKKKHS